MRRDDAETRRKGSTSAQGYSSGYASWVDYQRCISGQQRPPVQLTSEPGPAALLRLPPTANQRPPVRGAAEFCRDAIAGMLVPALTTRAVIVSLQLGKTPLWSSAAGRNWGSQGRSWLKAARGPTPRDRRAEKLRLLVGPSSGIPARTVRFGGRCIPVGEKCPQFTYGGRPHDGGPLERGSSRVLHFGRAPRERTEHLWTEDVETGAYRPATSRSMRVSALRRRRHSVEPGCRRHSRAARLSIGPVKIRHCCRRRL